MTTAQGNRYIIEKDEYTQDGLDCTHPLCDRFHRKGCPTPKRIEWVIVDTTTGRRADINHQATYSHKRDAVAALQKFLSNQNRETL